MSLPRLLALTLLMLPAIATAQEDPTPTEAPAHGMQLQYEAAPVRTAYPPVVPATSPLRRTAPIESRLTCDDYSMSYFARHPAMAAVCGVNPQQAAAEALAAAASPTTPSPTQP